ncbi:MAG TPA: hypothetical protein VK390_08865, partial [Propionibacteriaceae bacterium]|nr:hypothetical protein [Propionibacteriaceae bacterium]
AHAGHGHSGGYGQAVPGPVPRIAGGSQEHSPDAPNPSEVPAVHGADELDHEHGWHAGATSEVPGEQRQIWPDLSVKELLTLLPLAVLTIYLGVYPQAVLTIVEPALQRILALVTP